MNRLTDEKLREIDRLDLNPYVRRMAQEILTLRKENEMLRKRVEVGDDLSKNVTQLLSSKVTLKAETEREMVAMQVVLGMLERSNKKWRESGGG